MTSTNPGQDGTIERPTGTLVLDRRYAKGGLPAQVHVPDTTLFENLEMSARRYPGKTAVQFYGAAYTYGELLRDAGHMAGYLQQACGVKPGDRVMLFSQNCPQFIAAYFAILRAQAVMVPVNAMLLEEELRHIAADSGAVACFAAQELANQLLPLLGQTPLRHVIVHAYGDALGDDDAGLTVPDWVRVRCSRDSLPDGMVSWPDALAEGRLPAPYTGKQSDLSMLPYTSGTTGAPKACVHDHRTVMTSVAGSQLWRNTNCEAVFLAVAPMFHLLGLQNSLNGPIFVGGTIVLLPRWDARTAAELIERHRVTFWGALPPMLVDFFNQPGIESRDLSSLRVVGGGGAAMPENTSALMRERYGLQYVEGYGLTETAAFLFVNPVHKPKPTCLGVRTYGVEAHVIDPETLQPVPRGEVGEIVVHGGQIMHGYWNNPKANEETFITLDGKRFFRTGDLACEDEEGYFFMRDRLKRMINASGYKVWPAEVETLLYRHPAIQETCVIAARDAHRGETVKAVVVLKAGHEGITADSLVAWGREHMAAYKAPRIVEIVASIPRTATGKLAWRTLQEAESMQ
ncbi:long-chain fatty acid--CoA ligase [Cupriavidus numazuensis]|uniref:Long-chain-fatty-acid--CoA ligase n=1 Tax=Cupriavidus numazuensis TaxID=221992 RepID=A0ABM8TNV1_9BURK|nr:long-chain fatty acid--CoA ligase [Cupriavidus numazuensis]CAG2156486.1 Long-chain-fatty-acid--CoA ligase [Cupriavidus numazuensis]